MLRYGNPIRTAWVKFFVDLHGHVLSHLKFSWKRKKNSSNVLLPFHGARFLRFHELSVFDVLKFPNSEAAFLGKNEGNGEKHTEGG